MKSRLIASANGSDEKKKLKDYYIEHRLIFDNLVKILEEERKVLVNQSESTKRYENPSWAYQQADFIGSKRVYDKVIDLLTIDPIEEKHD
jgi:hypothetical protein